MSPSKRSPVRNEKPANEAPINLTLGVDDDKSVTTGPYICTDVGLENEYLERALAAADKFDPNATFFADDGFRSIADAMIHD